MKGAFGLFFLTMRWMLDVFCWDFTCVNSAGFACVHPPAGDIWIGLHLHMYQVFLGSPSLCLVQFRAFDLFYDVCSSIITQHHIFLEALVVYTFTDIEDLTISSMHWAA